MEIRNARLEDVDGILALIRQRIGWMDEKGLEQWNKTEYLSVYPRSYFEEIIRRGDVFIASENGAVVGAEALFPQDPRWSAEENRDTSALYVHHLVSDLRTPGVGRSLLAFAEDLARARSIQALRLDSADGNAALEGYYTALGYTAVGTCVDGPYVGIKREKRLDG